MAEPTKSPFPPFMKGAAEAPAAAAPAAAEAVKAPKEKKAKKADGERKTPAKAMNPEQIQQVLSMVKDNSYTAIGEALGITKHQVNRVLMEVKKNLINNSKDDPIKKAKVDAYIKEFLSRPEDSKPGSSGPKGGKVKNALNDIVGNILAGL